MPWSGEQGLAGIMRFKFLWADPLFTAVGFAGQNQHPAVIANTSQNRGTTVIEQQQDGQVERGDVFKLATQQARLQTGPGRCTRQQVRLRRWCAIGSPALRLARLTVAP